MAKNSTTFISPSLGIDSSIPATYIDPRSSPRHKNVQVWKALIEKRRGGALYGATLAERVLSVGSFIRESAQSRFRVGPTKFQGWDGSAWQNRAHAALTGNDTHIVDWAVPELAGKKILVYTNYIDAPRKWTGTGNDALLGGSPPKCRYFINYQGYLLALNTEETGTAYPSRVRWPEAGNIEGWASGDYGVKDLLDDAKEITGGENFGRYAAVHKETAIYLGYLTGTSSTIRFERREAQGTAAGNTILNLPDGSQAYVSKTGIRLFNGVNAPLIQSPVNEELRETMNPEYIYRSFGLLMEHIDEAWFWVPIGSSQNPDTIFKYNFITRQIYKDERSGATAAGLHEITDQESWDEDPDSWDSDPTAWNSLTSQALAPRAIIGYSGGVTLERTDTPDDNGVAVDSEWETKDYTAADLGYDDPEGMEIEWQGIEMIIKGTAIDVYYSLDQGTTFTLIGRKTLTSSWPTYRAPIISYFRAFNATCRFKFKNNIIGGSFAIKQIRPIAVQREGRQ